MALWKATVFGGIHELKIMLVECKKYRYSLDTFPTTRTTANVILETLWNEFLKILTVEVGSRVVETWFKAITLERWDARSKVMYLKARNAFIQEWVRTHYQPVIVKHLTRLLNEEHVAIAFVDQTTENDESTAKTAAETSSSRNPTGAESKDYQNRRRIKEEKPVAHKRNVSHDAILPFAKNNLFETFIVGQCNAMAFAAAHAVAQNTGKLYNPLIIAGGSGLGKTHLLHAIGNHIRRIDRGATIVYQSADRFVHEYVTAVRSERIQQFEARYNGVDVLLMDDIQCLSHKEHTQNMFFQIFTRLQQTRKQVVLTCDVAPRNMPGFSDRIRSRLEGGLVTDIQEADQQMRVAILRHKLTMQNVELDDKVIDYMATTIEGNIRDLEGSLIRVLAFSSLTNQPINTDLVGRVLAHSYAYKKVNVDLATIAGHVSNHFAYLLSDLRSPRRPKDLTHARHVALYPMKRLSACSLREIAYFLGRRDHSTVLYAVATIEKKRNNDVHFAQLLRKLEQSATQPAAVK